MKVLLLTAALSLTALAARADEVIATHSGEVPTAQATAASPLDQGAQAKRQADGDWARRVIAGLPSEEPQDGAAETLRPRCPANDGKPHGEVWVGVGTGGYKTAGVAASQPLGDCGEVAIAVSRTEGGALLRRGPRGGPHR